MWCIFGNTIIYLTLMKHNLRHEEHSGKGAFYIVEDDRRVATIDYLFNGPHTITVVHTWVDPSLRGQNIGVELLEALVSHCREHQLKIIPVCSYAKALMDRSPQWKDVLERTEGE